MSNGLRGGDHDKGRGLLGLARLKVQAATAQMRSPSPNGLATPRSQTVRDMVMHGMAVSNSQACALMQFNSTYTTTQAA